MVNTEIRWGWQDPMITYKRSQEMSQAACRLVACDYGLKKTLSSSNIPRWIQLSDDSLDEGKDDPLPPSHFGSNAYLENIESRY